MFTDRDKLRYYIQVCREGATFAKTVDGRQAFAEALKKLKEFIYEE